MFNLMRYFKVELKGKFIKFIEQLLKDKMGQRNLIQKNFVKYNYNFRSRYDQIEKKNI